MSNENPSWMTEDHVMYADTVQKFVGAEITPNIERWRKEGVADRNLWRKAGEAGILGASLPEEYGGSGLPISFDAITTYEHARSGDSAWGFGIQSFVAHYVASYGTEEQKQRWLPGIASGEIVTSLAMTEPGTGSDLQSVKTTAIKDGNQYRINGSKTFITNGQTSDLICLVAKTDPNESAKGVSLIMVETEDLEGFRRGRNLEKLGLKGQDTSELFFDDVMVPQTNLLGTDEGQGFYQLMRQLPWERLNIALTAIGAMDFMITHTLDYVKERKAFGKRIFDFQNTRFKLAEAKTSYEVTRAFVNECVVKLDAGTLDAATASMAKWWASQQQNEIADECLQLFGGYGFMMEYPIANSFADARVQKIYGGSNEIMKELVARSLDG